MNAVSIYDPDLWSALEPANVRGGRSRAANGKRDILGRFLSSDPVQAIQQVHNLPYDHGVAGGVARAIKAPRDTKGRFIKAQQEKQNE